MRAYLLMLTLRSDFVDINGKPFLRSRTDKMVGGVCGGLAKCYGKDAMLFRAGFVITSFFGGLTTLVYLYLMFTQPEETE